MAGNKRTFSQMDNGKDNPSPNTLVEILAAANTDNLQDLFEIPGSPSEDLAMLDAFDFQAPPIDSDNNGAVSDPGNALVLQDLTQATQVEEAVSTEANEQAIAEKAAEPAKPPRKRRRKGDPEPDHSVLVREKSSKSKRCGQACDRCHIRRFKCDEVKGGCLMCLRSGIECKMTNRVTGETMVRGGAEGVVINFDDIQRENEEVKKENEKLRDEIEQLRSVNGKLQDQLQYYYNRFSIGTIPGPSHAPPVSDLSRILPNPNPHTQAMPQSNRDFLYGNQTSNDNNNNNNNGTIQPVASNYNNNAFSGNKSIASSAPLPISSSMLNSLSHSEWVQLRHPHGLPTASRNKMVTYPLLSQIRVPMRDDAAQSVSFPGASGQGMNQGMQMQNFQGLGVQGQSSQNLPTALDAQSDQVNCQRNTSAQSQHNCGQDTNAYFQGTSQSLKTLNQDFQTPCQYLIGGTQGQMSQHESKNDPHQDLPNAKVPYIIAHNYPFNFPQPAPQNYLEPVVQFQGTGHQKTNNHIPNFLNDPLGGIKSEDDTTVEFDLEPGFSWTSPRSATFPSLDLDTTANQTSIVNPGDASPDLFALSDGSNPYQAQDLSDQEILGLLEDLAQQKQSQPLVHKRVQKSCSDIVEVKIEGPGNYDSDSDCFGVGSSEGDVSPFI